MIWTEQGESAAVSSGSAAPLASQACAGLAPARFAALFALCFLIAAVPILCVGNLPLVDWPNHMARMHIIAAATASPALAEAYAIVWRPIPDLAMDAIVPLLARIMPLAWAGKAFLLLTFLLLAGGTAALHRVLFQRWSAWACLAFLLLYNRALLWGFGNFLFGTGLALVAFALWVHLRRRAAPARHFLAALFASAIYLSHLFAFGAYALMILGYELGLWRERGAESGRSRLRALAAAGAQFILPVALFLAAGHSGGSGPILYSRFVRKFDIAFSIFDNYVPWFDVASFLLLALLFILGGWRRMVKLHPAMTAPLLLLLAAQIAMPNRIFGAAGVDHRMPLILAILLIAATKAQVRLPFRRVIAGGLALLFVARIAVVAAVWTADERALAPLAAALTHVPKGSRVAVAYAPDAIHVPRRGPPVAHIAALAVIAADAFVPTLFADPGQQPLRLRPRYAALASLASPGEFWDVLVAGRSDPGGRVGRALAQYDYVLFAGGGPFAPLPSAPLVFRAAGPGAKLFAIDRGAAQIRGGGALTIGG